VRGFRLAWHNLAHQPTRFFVTVAGITCATLLMIVQGSLLISFLKVASKIIDATDSDLWIAGRGTPCFEFPATLERRFIDLAHGVPGVAQTGRICTRVISFKKQDGSEQLVSLIGSEAAGSNFPVPLLARDSNVIEPDALLIDESARELLKVRESFPAGVEINGRRANVIGELSGYSSFLGTPYVFTSYSDGARYADLRTNETMFILVRLRAGADREQVKRDLRGRLPGADIWTRAEFSRRAQIYWSSQTGAGSAILAAAFLGLFVGLAVVSQAVYATTMEHIEEFATLKALGARSGFVVQVITWQALASGITGYLLGVALSGPAVGKIRSAIPWLSTQTWLPAAILPVTLAMCIVASVLAVRAALSVEPARVFRA
jgi:putative ABC transport system permease protein